MQLISSGLAVSKKALAAVVMLVVVSAQGLSQAQVLPASIGPAKLGGLMLSPIQRQNLEYVRSTGRSLAGAEQNADQLLDPNAGLSTSLTISGVVMRSGNRSTVWVNNQPLYGQGGESALRAQAGRAGVLKMGSQDMRTLAKPGQTIDVKTRQATDMLPPSSIKIIPPKASTAAKDKQER